MQGLLVRRTTAPLHLPHRAAAFFSQSSANPQPILSESSSGPAASIILLDVDNLEPDDADACRGYVSYRTSTLKTIPGEQVWCVCYYRAHGTAGGHDMSAVMEPGEVTKVGRSYWIPGSWNLRVVYSLTMSH